MNIFLLLFHRNLIHSCWKNSLAIVGERIVVIYVKIETSLFFPFFAVDSKLDKSDMNKRLIISVERKTDKGRWVINELFLQYSFYSNYKLKVNHFRNKSSDTLTYKFHRKTPERACIHKVAKFYVLFVTVLLQCWVHKNDALHCIAYLCL